MRSTQQYLKFDARHRLGFLSNPKRFNVSVTRAQALLIVIGNPRVLAGDANWGELLRQCLRNGAYTGVSLPEGIAEEGFDPASVGQEVGEEELDMLMSTLALDEEGGEGGESAIALQECPEWRREM